MGKQTAGLTVVVSVRRDTKNEGDFGDDCAIDLPRQRERERERDRRIAVAENTRENSGTTVRLRAFLFNDKLLTVLKVTQAYS